MWCQPFTTISFTILLEHSLCTFFPISPLLGGKEFFAIYFIFHGFSLIFPQLEKNAFFQILLR
jgi:hypothetical protein